MKKVLSVAELLAVFALVFLALGCSINAAFVKGVDGYAEVILPEYEAYLERDASLSPETKKLRKETATRFRALIKEAKK